MKIYFITSNKNKAAEAAAFFEETDVKGTHNIEFRVIEHNIDEILDPDLNFVVTKKTLEAYRYLKQPCLVEMSGLFFDGIAATPRTTWENNLESCWRPDV